MTTSCHQCGAGLPVAASRTGVTRCAACIRGLTGARNEHSVLFSLADLATASASGTGFTVPIAAPQRRVASRLDEGSGLIDLRAIKSAARDHTLAPAHLLIPPTLTPAEPPRHSAATSASQRPLYGLVATLMFTLASLTAFVLSEPPPSPPPSPRHTIPAPMLAVATTPEAAPEPEPAPAPPVTAEPSPEPTITPATSSDAPRRKPGRRATATPTPETTPPPRAPSPPVADSDDDTMKCLLGTGACKVERPTSDVRPTPAPAATSSLPERLGDVDITAGTAPAKASATARCAPLARGDERVRIKLSIAGPTGTVIRASAEDDGGNASLAACCAAELEKATFKQVQRPQMGALVTIKF